LRNKKLLLLSGSIILCWLLLEATSFFLIPANQRSLPPEQLMKKYHNEYLQEYSLKTGCTFAESVIAHPMLGFVHRRAPFISKKCTQVFKANNIGVLSERDLPLKKNPDDFAIMILGGSVADHMANYKIGNVFQLEKLLNEKFVPLSGKQFKIYNGAMGAWAMPSQVNMLLMYGDRIDAAISLDGYNEAFPVQEGARLEKVPAGTYFLSFADRGSLKIRYLNMLWAYQYAVSHSFLKHSYFFPTFYHVLTQIYQNFIVSPEDLDPFITGNTEQINLPKEEARLWSAESLGKYMQAFHETGRFKKIKTAEFLQPTRFTGKILTDEEKAYHEYIEAPVYNLISAQYNRLEKEKYPVKSLATVFEKEQGTIYSDHIHYRTDPDGERSRGKDLVAEAMVNELGHIWNLKKR